MSQPGDLSPELLKAIFDREVRPIEYGHVVLGSQGAPVLVIVGGQPGAGKTRSLAQAVGGHPGIVAVVGDKLRRFHPQYRQVMATDPLAMPAVTAQAANAWVHMSLDYLREAGRSVLLETTLRQPDAVEASLREFRAAGYATELRVLAVPEELSRMGTVTRYVAQVSADGAGRWAPSRFHDAAYTAAPVSLSRACEAGLVDRVLVIDRSANVLADIPAGADTGRQAGEAVAALAGGREIAATTTVQARQWCSELAENADLLAAWGESDPDLVATVCLLSERASEIAAIGWPDDPVRASAEAARVHAAVASLPVDCDNPAYRPLRDRIAERYEKARAARPKPTAGGGSQPGRARRGTGGPL